MIPGKKSMLPKEKRRIQTRIDRVSDKLIDLCLELRDLRFPPNTPIMKDVAKIKIYLISCLDHLDLSIQMRDAANTPFTLEAELEEASDA